MRYAEVTDMKRIFGGTLTLKNGRIDKYQFDEGYCQAEKYIYNTSQDDFTFCYYDQNHVKICLGTGTCHKQERLLLCGKCLHSQPFLRKWLLWPRNYTNSKKR